MGRFPVGQALIYSKLSVFLTSSYLVQPTDYCSLVPIGRGVGDGLTYVVNPRFDGQGRMRRRVDWPAELR